jgi:TatD DNase family protein
LNIPFIDIHTHHPMNSEEILSVPSLFLQDIYLHNELNGPFSAAIHPWHAAKFAPEQVIGMLEDLIKQPRLFAIGETGLDKSCPTDIKRQKEIFEIHLAFAEEYHKPLIIHSVRSWNDLIGFIRHASVPFILHGYSEGIELTKRLIDLGCYFSLGKSVLQLMPRFRETIQFIPLSSLFFETDDSHLTIADIYKEAGKIMGISLDDLKIQINKNYNTLSPIQILNPKRK